jgi:hypothetical protein
LLSKQKNRNNFESNSNNPGNYRQYAKSLAFVLLSSLATKGFVSGDVVGVSPPSTRVIFFVVFPCANFLII